MEIEPRVSPEAKAVRRNLKTPIAGAIAGIAFAVLFSISMVMMDATVADISSDRGAWLLQGEGRFSFAVGLVPFAGIFFLWFMAVVRDRLGDAEDRFFATVFLGSGVLFLGMIFCASAVSGAMVAGYARSRDGFAGGTTFLFSRDLVYQLFSVYAMRMAAVFVISQATLWVLTGVMPRWVAVLGYVAGLAMLLGGNQLRLTILLLPAWIFIVSAYILVANLRGRSPGLARVPTDAPSSSEPESGSP